jgi:hypothetical protein
MLSRSYPPLTPATHAARPGSRNAEPGRGGRVSRRRWDRDGACPAAAYGSSPRPAMTLWSRPRFAAHQFPPCSRRLAVTRVASWLELAGRPNPLRVNPISGTSLIPACNGCVPRRYGRGLNRGRASTRPSVPFIRGFPREWGRSARTGTVPRGDRNASPSLLLGGVRPAKRLCHDSLSASSPEDGSGSLRRTHAASFGSVVAGGAGVDQRIRAGSPIEKRSRSGSKRVRPPRPGTAVQSSSG